jgi:hypothetical protein
MFWGHIDDRTAENYRSTPVVVKYHYTTGTEEKVADNICANCGHFLNDKAIADGHTKINKGHWVPYDWGD